MTPGYSRKCGDRIVIGPEIRRLPRNGIAVLDYLDNLLRAVRLNQPSNRIHRSPFQYPLDDKALVLLQI